MVSSVNNVDGPTALQFGEIPCGLDLVEMFLLGLTSVVSRFVLDTLSFIAK
jgi:hypothetical protein